MSARCPGVGIVGAPFRRDWKKLIMGIPDKLKEYLDTNRSVYIDKNRGSLPAITDPEEPLHIDSLGLIRLVAFLENELGYRIEDEEMIAENFTTLRKLEDLLATKTPMSTR
jgi:acyl carrier protein